MLLITDGHKIAVSATFPFPYSIFPTIKFFDSGRRFSTALTLIFLETFLCLAFVYLLVANPQATGFTAYSIGFPSLLVLLKFAFQKMINMKTSHIKIVGVAPIRIWVEHLFLCFALGLSGLWANRMQDFELLAPSIFTVIVFISAVSAVWPFLNLALYKLRMSRSYI